MNYLIDTNICIYVMNHRPVEVIQTFKRHPPGTIGISSITLSELQYGVSKGRNSAKNQKRLDEFLMPLELLSFPGEAAKVYGDIRVTLEQKGQVIGTLDLLIAAHALYEGRILVTNNAGEFKRIPGLKWENWVKK